MTGMTQLPLDLGHRVALGGEDFHVAEANREAVTWLDRWPDWPAPGLAIYGPAGSGKTHLAHVWSKRSGAAILGPGALNGLEAREAAGRGPVAIDGLGEAPLGDEAERRLLHLYNALAEAGRHLLLLGRTAPARWPLQLPDLRSRLAALPSVAMAMPDDELFEAVLMKLFADRQLIVEGEVLRYLAQHIERSFAAARDMVARLDSAALAERRSITLPLARRMVEADE